MAAKMIYCRDLKSIIHENKALQLLMLASHLINEWFLQHCSDMSNYLKFAVKPIVTLVSHPSTPTVRKGHNITLFCQDKSGNDEIVNSFSWNQHGRLLKNNTSTLQIVRADSDVNGAYLCKVKNIAGEDFNVVTVTVVCE